MSEIEGLTTRVADFSSKTDFWNNGVLIFLIMTALAAAGIVICQRLAFVRAGQMASAQGELDAAKEHEARTERDRVRTDLAKAQESLGLAEQHSAEADAKAEGFRLDIAKANERAAEANRIAEQERLARRQLERRLADRILLPQQVQAFSASLSFAKGVGVDIGVLGQILEIANFTKQIADALRAAGIAVRQWDVSNVSGRGVLVGTKPESGTLPLRLATSLVERLRSFGIDASSWKYDELTTGGLRYGPSEPMDAPVRIFIGSKPGAP